MKCEMPNKLDIKITFYRRIIYELVRLFYTFYFNIYTLICVIMCEDMLERLFSGTYPLSCFSGRMRIIYY